MTTWTRKDQIALDELTQRRAEFMRASRDPLIRALDNYSRLSLSDCEALCDVLINRADKFRDLLEPFDSGVRCVASPPEV